MDTIDGRTIVTESMLTTVDNPFDPFTEFPQWFSYDARLGHHTSEYLARITFSSDALSEVDQNLANTLAIDEAMDLNISGLFKKVSRKIFVDTGLPVGD